MPRLVEALRQQRDDFAAVVFFTYLYYPTYWGLDAAPERSALVPTTHDEPPLRFSIYGDVFAAPQAFGFLTPAEEALVRSRFPLGERRGFQVGMGIETPVRPDVAGFRARHGLERPYVLYAGRIDAGKGCAELVAFHEQYRREKADAVELVLIGKLAMPLPDEPGVRYLGFLSEAGEGRGHGRRAGDRVLEPVREPLDRAARGLRARHARPRQRALGRAARALPALERGALLRGRRRVRGGDGSARCAIAACAMRWPRTAAATSTPSYRWGVVLDRWRALIAAAGGRRP